MKNSQTEVRGNKISKRRGIVILLVVTISIAGLVGLFYWQTTKNQIYIEKAEVFAPSIALSSSNGGILKEIFVQEGDIVPANSAVAQVGEEIIKTSTNGLVIQTNNNIGENFSPNAAVVSIINPDDLRVVARAEENKGLSDIAVGQSVIFTIDAFGSKKFDGVVSEVSPTSRDSGLVFNISDKREVKEFDVKIKFDEKQYPELKNGMSAEVWIIKN